MAQQAVRAPLAVYMLADHLDAALAAGEDLVARGSDWRSLAEKPGDPAAFANRQRGIVEEIRGPRIDADRPHSEGSDSRRRACGIR